MATTFTLREAADELGVHYMTAYRYVRLGLLAAEKSGGVWQVGSAALDDFRDGSGAGPVDAGESAPWADRFEARLVDGDSEGSWRVVEAAMAAGSEPRAVYLEILSPAMVSIGARWAAGEFDVSVEHQATGIVMRIIGRLGPRFSRRGRSCGGLVVGAPSGERHGLPTAILADLMRMHGWDVVDLGPDTPTESFLRAADRMSDLRAVGISVTHSSHLGMLGSCCSALRDERPDLRIVVGGRAFESEEHAISLGADALSFGADHMNELLKPVAG